MSDAFRSVGLLIVFAAVLVADVGRRFGLGSALVFGALAAVVLVAAIGALASAPRRGELP